MTTVFQHVPSIHVRHFVAMELSLID